jgi:hypothetical protein
MGAAAGSNVKGCVMIKTDAGGVVVRTMRPRRFGKGFFRRLFIVLLTPVIGYAGWGGWLQWRIDARLAALHAAGEPVSPADFDVPAPPPGQNAADDLIRAGAMVQQSEEMLAFYRMTGDYWVMLPLTDQEVSGIGAAVSANKGAIGLMESGLRKEQVAWPADSRGLFKYSSWLDHVGYLGEIVRLDALLAHQAGREAEAVARVRQLVEMARVVERNSRAAAAHYAVVRLLWTAALSAEAMAYDLHVGGAAGGVAAAEVHALIRDLLDDPAWRAAMVGAMQKDRIEQYQFWVGMSRGASRDPSVTGPAMRFVTWPLAARNADLSVRMESALLYAFRRSSDLPTTGADAEVAAVLAYVRSSPMNIAVDSPSPPRAVVAHYQLTVDLRLAAVALAMRLYAVEHGGRGPQALAELVPRYLPGVPGDPMVAGSPRLRCVASAGGLIVYSVGCDGIDDGGSEEARPELRSHYYAGKPVWRWDAKDAVLPVKRPARYFPQGEDGLPGARGAYVPN